MLGLFTYDLQFNLYSSIVHVNLRRCNRPNQKHIYNYLFTVPLQVQMVTDYFKPIWKESVFTNVALLLAQRCIYYDGLVP